jgi:N-acetylmuramoyl-L-alanine amidase
MAHRAPGRKRGLLQRGESRPAPAPSSRGSGPHAIMTPMHASRLTRRLALVAGSAALLPARARGARVAAPLVMLDPGHGGKDPGAIGIGGAYEKHVALAAALQLKRLLEAGGRYRVELTRQDDVFIPLDGRVDRAQSRGAALFMSMHADSVGDPSVRGASVYTLGAEATDRQTAALARRENSADRFDGKPFRDQPPEVAEILASLVRRETRAGSARLARSAVAALAPSVRLLANPSRRAAFVVLKAADIPSVLVEMGFMSNAQDEAALQRADHRLAVATALQRAVDGFFTAPAPYPPSARG